MMMMTILKCTLDKCMGDGGDGGDGFSDRRGQLGVAAQLPQPLMSAGRRFIIVIDLILQSCAQRPERRQTTFSAYTHARAPSLLGRRLLSVITTSGFTWSNCVCRNAGRLDKTEIEIRPALSRPPCLCAQKSPRVSRARSLSAHSLTTRRSLFSYFCQNNFSRYY